MKIELFDSAICLTPENEAETHQLAHLLKEGRSMKLNVTDWHTLGDLKGITFGATRLIPKSLPEKP